MSLVFTSSRTVPPSGTVSISAAITEQPIPNNSVTLVNYADHYANVVTKPQLSTASEPPIADIGPYNTQLDISDKVIYANTTDIDTIILGYEYQLKFDHYDTSIPSGTVKVCYLGGDAVPNVLYKLEACVDTIMWEDYRDNGAGMTDRYDDGLTWGPVPTGVTVYRLRLLLSEDVCFTGETLCVAYTKVRDHTGLVTNTSHIVEGWREIINPKKLYTYTTDYTFSYSPDTVTLDGDLTGKSVWLRRSKLANIRSEISSASDREGWFVKLWAGSFADVSGNVYGIQEYNTNQAAAVKFSSTSTLISPRCGMMVYDVVNMIDVRTIQLSESHLHYWDEGYPMYIPYPAYDALYYTDIDPTSSENYSHGITLIVDGNRVDNTIIKDIDAWNGIILLNTPISQNSSMRATYYYEQNYYPLQLPDICPQIHHVGHSYASSTAAADGMADGDSVVICLLPKGSETYSNENVVWYYKSNNPTDIYDGTYYGWSSVVRETALGNASVTLVTGTIKIAEISIVRRNPDVAVTLYDSRTRGGGLYPDYYYPIVRDDNRDRLDVQDETNYYADIGLYDGLGLKKDGVIIVKVPMVSITGIRDAIVTYSLDEIKRLASIISEYNPEMSAADALTEATNNYRDQYAYTEAIRTVRNVAEGNAAAGVKVVLVDEDMNVI